MNAKSIPISPRRICARLLVPAAFIPLPMLIGIQKRKNNKTMVPIIFAALNSCFFLFSFFISSVDLQLFATKLAMLISLIILERCCLAMWKMFPYENNKITAARENAMHMLRNICRSEYGEPQAGIFMKKSDNAKELAEMIEEIQVAVINPSVTFVVMYIS